ncbi:MAG: AI-2E family transporter [Clostridia bacterium]|nr:AI-2E family transporter [Clostridia bacterium]
MDFNSKKLKSLSRWIIGIAAACIIIFLAIENIGVVAGAVSWVLNLVMPLIVGFAIALILNVPMRWLETKLFKKSKKPFWQKLRRPLAFIISLVLILGILVGVIWLVIPALVDAVKVIVQSVIDFINKISAMDKAEIAELPFGNALLNIDWGKMLTTLQDWLKNQSGNIVNTAFGTISSLLGGIFDLFVSLVFSVYILFGKETLKKQFLRLVNAWLPKRFSAWLVHALSIANTNFRNFVSGQSIEAVILGTLCLIGMLILGIPYAPMVSALVGVTALIPVVGAFIGAIVGGFMILTVQPIKAVIFVVFLVILQQLEGNIIYPKVMGNKVNLPGMWILAVVTVGGTLAGPVGMLLSVPIGSTAYVLIKEATAKREENKKSAE